MKEIEIEFKNLLTEGEFTLLRRFLNIDESLFIKQENHYFDTPSFSLKGVGCALRIRYKNNKFMLTLKEPLSVGLLETNQVLTDEEADTMISGGAEVPEGPVKEQLVALNIPTQQIVYFGTLTTIRAEKEFKNGLIVLDYSSYLNQTDYEVEYEVDNYEAGKEVFQNLLHELKIPIRKTENKIQRFYNAKY